MLKLLNKPGSKKIKTATQMSIKADMYMYMYVYMYVYINNSLTFCCVAKWITLSVVCMSGRE